MDRQVSRLFPISAFIYTFPPFACCHLSNRTLAPLQFPPHVIAIACLFLASLLDSFEKPPPDGDMEGHTSSHDLVKLLGDHGKWEETYQARVEDIEGMFYPSLVSF